MKISGKIYFFFIQMITAVNQPAIDLAFYENYKNYLLHGFSLLPI